MWLPRRRLRRALSICLYAYALWRHPPCGLRWRVTGVTPAPRNRHTRARARHAYATALACYTYLRSQATVNRSAALCALVSDDAAIDPRPLLGLTRLLGERLRLPLGELVEARGQLHQVLLRLLGLGREAGHLECTGWQRGHMGRQPAPRRSPTSGARPSSARSICRPGIYPRIRLAAYLPIYY